MEETLFLELAQLCENLSKTTKRLEKIDMICNFLKKLKTDEIAPAVLLIIGWNFPETLTEPLGISYATLMDILNEKKQETLIKQYLTIKNVKNYFEKIASISGPGSKQKKKDLLLSLLSQASPLEAKWLIKNIFGEMQHGVSNGLMIEAIAHASNIEEKYIRRAYMFIGDLGKIAEIALIKGKEGILNIGIEIFHPIKPMLAEMNTCSAFSLATLKEYVQLEFSRHALPLPRHIPIPSSSAALARFAFILAASAIPPVMAEMIIGALNLNPRNSTERSSFSNSTSGRHLWIKCTFSKPVVMLLASTIFSEHMRTWSLFLLLVESIIEHLLSTCL